MSENAERPKHAGGRPTEYRPEYCELVIAEMAKGYSIGAFAGGINVTRKTVSNWMETYPEFFQAVSRGKAVRLRQWETAAMQGAYTQQGGNATLIIFGLKNAGRGSGGEESDWTEPPQDVKVSGAVGTYDLRKLDDDGLKRLETTLAAIAVTGRDTSGDSET